jgi:hypothetical protein
MGEQVNLDASRTEPTSRDHRQADGQRRYRAPSLAKGPLLATVTSSTGAVVSNNKL